MKRIITITPVENGYIIQAGLDRNTIFHTSSEAENSRQAFIESTANDVALRVLDLLQAKTHGPVASDGRVERTPVYAMDGLTAGLGRETSAYATGCASTVDPKAEEYPANIRIMLPSGLAETVGIMIEHY